MEGLCEGLVYVDEHMLVLDKPAGLLAVPGRGADKQDCLATRALQLWPDALVTHRLDMPTSGLFVMARGLVMQRRLNRSFEDRDVVKGYEAVVTGLLALDEGTVDLPIGADWPDRPRQKIDHDTGRPSVTRWKVLARDPVQETTRVALAPLTGRTHQLRVHLQAIGHAILGDALYATPEVEARAPRLLLHATHLQLTHPDSGERVSFSSAAPF